MHIGFLNPQGNFDSNDSYLAEHPDFGGQLVYVKQVAIAIAQKGHKVDILTRQILDPQWSEFAEQFDGYPGVENLRIVRLPAGPKEFLRKELLWPYLAGDWVPNILKFYQEEGSLPDLFTTHYGDGGIAGVLIENETDVPFTFTGHSLGAQKMDKLDVTPENLAEMDDYYHFRYRILAERLCMNRSAINITSTKQERYQQYGHRAYSGAVDPKDDRRFAVIPPGVNPTIFGAEVRSENEANTHKLVEEKLGRDLEESRQKLPAILASSRLAPKKNVLGLVKAFAVSETLQTKANLVIITNGIDDPLREENEDEQTEKVLAPIREVVQENNLWGKISAFSLPNQPALAATYRFLAERGSVFALTSHFEPFGLAPLEAAVAGLPTVVTQNSGIAEDLQVDQQKYAVLVDPSEPKDIARGLKKVLEDQQLWQQFHQETREYVIENFTWEATAENYLNVFQEIVANGSDRRPQDLLSIPQYFLEPKPENDLSLESLSQLYFRDQEKPSTTASDSESQETADSAQA